MKITQFLAKGFKWSIGFVIYHVPLFRSLRRRYMARLYTGEGWLFRSFRAYVLGHVVYRDLVAFRRDFLAGATGTNWSDCYYSRGEEYYQEHFRHALKLCSDALQEDPSSRFMQVGCAGGRELSILAAGFPLKRFCGVDLSPETIQQDRERYRSFPNLEFRAADITVREQWTVWHPEIIYSSGCLEYLAGDEVAAFFKAALESGVRELILFEPSDPALRGASVPRGGGAYAHDYGELLRRAGWEKIQIHPETGPGWYRVLIRARCG